MNRDTKGPRAMGRSTRDGVRQFRQPPPPPAPRPRVGFFWWAVIAVLLLAIAAGATKAGGLW